MGASSTVGQSAHPNFGYRLVLCRTNRLRVESKRLREYRGMVPNFVLQGTKLPSRSGPASQRAPQRGPGPFRRRPNFETLSPFQPGRTPSIRPM